MELTYTEDIRPPLCQLLQAGLDGLTRREHHVLVSLQRTNKIFLKL